MSYKIEDVDLRSDIDFDDELQSSSAINTEEVSAMVAPNRR